MIFLKIFMKYANKFNFQDTRGDMIHSCLKFYFKVLIDIVLFTYQGKSSLEAEKGKIIVIYQEETFRGKCTYKRS